MSSTARLEAIARIVVADVSRSLPLELREVAQRCQIVYEGVASDPEDEGLLGLFTGCSLLDGSPEGPGEFPVITLFLREIWEISEGVESVFHEEVRVTYLHELGHYLGWDEEEIEIRGLA